VQLPDWARASLSAFSGARPAISQAVLDGMFMKLIVHHSTHLIWKLKEDSGRIAVTMTTDKILISFSLTFFLACACADASSVYSFANLTSATDSTATVPGIVTGSIVTPGGTVGITFSGDVSGYTEVNNSGTNYYTGYESVYENSTVANIPLVSDIIALNEAYQTTGLISFSTPVVNPILDIVSLGSPGDTVSYTFTSAPTILSQGAAYWGGCSTCLSVSGDTLSGIEGSGVVELAGTFSSIGFTEAGRDDLWDGFTVGIAGTAVATPEPSTLPLCLAAFPLLFLFKRFQKSSSR
jgi:hypothetical protein